MLYCLHILFFETTAHNIAISMAKAKIECVVHLNEWIYTKNPFK